MADTGLYERRFSRPVESVWGPTDGCHPLGITAAPIVDSLWNKGGTEVSSHRTVIGKTAKEYLGYI